MAFTHQAQSLTASGSDSLVQSSCNVFNEGTAVSHLNELSFFCFCISTSNFNFFSRLNRTSQFQSQQLTLNLLGSELATSKNFSDFFVCQITSIGINKIGKGSAFSFGKGRSLLFSHRSNFNIQLTQLRSYRASCVFFTEFLSCTLDSCTANGGFATHDRHKSCNSGIRPFFVSSFFSHFVFLSGKFLY